MIIDCTMFHWEFDLLEIRLRELWDTVDFFVVTESVCDHRGNERDLVLSNNLSRFDWASTKLIVNVADKPKSAISSWDFEKYQRYKSVKDAVELLKPQKYDLLLISDVDEIMRPDVVRRMAQMTGSFTVQMPMYYYFLNLYLTEWFHPKACSFGLLSDPNEMRTGGSRFNVVDNGGWHFSYLGDAKQIQNKLNTFAHTEFDVPEFTDESKILERIMNHRDLFDRPGHSLKRVDLDKTWPRVVLKDLVRYSKWII